MILGAIRYSICLCIKVQEVHDVEVLDLVHWFSQIAQHIPQEFAVLVNGTLCFIIKPHLSDVYFQFGKSQYPCAQLCIAFGHFIIA